MNEHKENLLSLTAAMLEYNEEALKRLAEDKEEEQSDTYFYEKVKPYVDLFDEGVQSWSNLCREWVERAKPKYLHPQQIETAADNLQQVVVQSFYVSSRNVRVKKMIHSNKYTLQSIMESLRHEGV
jgi:hypothetical protein